MPPLLSRCTLLYSQRIMATECGVSDRVTHIFHMTYLCSALGTSLPFPALEISSPVPPTLSPFSLTLSPCSYFTSLISSSCHQHPEAQKQTSITRRPQKSALVPAGACSSLQDPCGQEDTSSWHQDQTQTSPDARQGTAPDGHCGRRGNRPRTPAA